MYLELVTSVKRERERVLPLLISNTFMPATLMDSGSALLKNQTLNGS